MALPMAEKRSLRHIATPSHKTSGKGGRASLPEGKRGCGRGKRPSLDHLSPKGLVGFRPPPREQRLVPDLF
eukprot:7468599-Pyramimonas_sp.AAC.2